VGSTLHDLSLTGLQGTASCIFVLNGTVYTAGAYRSTAVPYWIDDVEYEYPTAGDGCTGNAILVQGGYIYIAGSTYSSSSQTYSACYWKDGTIVGLPGSDAKASSIAVDGSGVVYTAGKNSNGARYVPSYWIGTTKTDLDGGIGNAAATSILKAADGSIYIGGTYNDGIQARGCYWKDSVRTDLPDLGYGSSCNAIWVISSGLVYAAGSYTDSASIVHSCYWMGSTRVDLPFANTNAVANAIFIVE
jgi:hypothetical protein